METSTIDDAQQQALRLEHIFMPYAMKQRADAFKEQTEKSLDAASDEDRLLFAHYTSADSALKIIDNKRIWMRNASCMSDYREVQHGFDILQKYFADKERAGVARFSAALDACAPGVAEEAFQLFDQWWAYIRLDTYITSISLHDAAHENRHGRLSMWRAFGGQPVEGAGVARPKGTLALVVVQ